MAKDIDEGNELIQLSDEFKSEMDLVKADNDGLRKSLRLLQIIALKHASTGKSTWGKILLELGDRILPEMKNKNANMITPDDYYEMQKRLNAIDVTNTKQLLIEEGIVYEPSR